MSTAKLKRGDSDLVSFGQMGGAFVSVGSDATIPAGLSVVAVTCLSANTQIPNGATGFPQMSGQNIPAGVTIYGRWDGSTFALGAGSAIIYFG
jgi:hypothetical protein